MIKKLSGLSGKRKLGLTLVFVATLWVLIFAGCGSQQALLPDTGNVGKQEEQHGSTTTLDWNMQADCVTCHQGLLDKQESEAALAVSTNHESIDCISCHTDTEGLTRAHRDAAGPSNASNSKLYYSKLQDDICLSCHGSREELASTTSDSTALTDIDGQVENPHALPTNDNHATIACGSCHTMHREADLEDVSRKVCASCHHEEVYVSCSSCHEDMA